MRLFKHSIWIARPREAVFGFFTDFSKTSRWRSYVRTMQLTGSAPLGVGSRVHVVMDLSGDEYKFDLDVLSYEPPALWRHRTDETDFKGYIEYRFEPENDGTRVTMLGDAKPVSLYGWLAVPLVWLRRGKSYEQQLPQLKSALEGGA